jgi:nucleoside-triphosphatase
LGPPVKPGEDRVRAGEDWPDDLARTCIFLTDIVSYPSESMDKVAKNLLITGEPGIGKSTLVKKLIPELKALKPVGFYTEDIRSKVARVGFQLVSFDGRRQNLAHVDMRSPVTVGKYRVSVHHLDDFLQRLDLVGSDGRLVVVDGIGKMECLSRKFREDICELLEQDRMFIATIAMDGDEMIDTLKRRDDITLFEMTRRNREDMVGKVLRWIRQIRFS